MASKQSPVAEKAPPVTRWNSDYVLSLYEQWKNNPESLPESWRMFFHGYEMAMCPHTCVASDRAHSQSQVASLIFAYRNEGHFIADINPLESPPESHPDLELGNFGFSEADLDTVFDTGHLAGMPQRATLREILQMLRDTYCRTVGVQYTHIQDVAIRRWLQEQMEPVRNRPRYDRETKLEILDRLLDAEMFEAFIQTRYPGQKRFSLEGAETLIASIHALVELAPELGVQEIVLGMAHRGRLNVLANILDKSYSQIFSEFEGIVLPDHYGGDGDVKYHKGFSSNHVNRRGKNVHISLTANPSHLEAVNAVAQGRARAKQRQLDDMEERVKVLPLLVHGDAAFTGQGMVAETLNMSQLRGYRTGGTVHIIINNQIGFTTDPRDSRSTAYCTDVMKMIEAPIFHVNGDDPEAVVYATELALRFRQKFHRDVIVDMLCYRVHGHNEGDEPAFTQPKLYEKIRKHPSVMKIYTGKLREEGVLSEEEEKQRKERFQVELQRSFESAHSGKPEIEVQAFDAYWKGLEEPYSSDPVETGVPRERLLEVVKALNRVPEDFHLHPKIARQLPRRLKMLENEGMVDWALAEALAFGSLLLEGTPVRLSGQDSQRGTFSHRHSVWTDVETEAKYAPLNHIREEQAEYAVYNSPLSEVSVLGFEYGYSLVEPRMLILWEAQFGDFSNGAQVIIDQFLVSSQSKWQRTSGIVLLLPHGYEGQGPEHSNAYLERYLAACAQDNIQVCNVTTPAQYFHLLRRQIKRPFRRPLVLMAPKSMLRHKRAVSPVEELVEGRFSEILDDPTPPANPGRVVFVSGKLYYDLIEKREETGADDVAIVRIEQFYPFNRRAINRIVEKYQGVDEVIWAQEESKNRGGWSFVKPWLSYLFPDHKLRYIGRGYAASPATGSLKRHREEQSHIVEAAILGEAVPYDVTVLPEGAAA